MPGPTFLVTGGCGFIGAHFIGAVLEGNRAAKVVNLDQLTYAASQANLRRWEGDARYAFQHGDVADAARVARLLEEYRPDAVFHFAAESHVDRSIDGADPFVATNVAGTARLAEAARRYWAALPTPERDRFRFVHVSTDEVFGSLAPDEAPSAEEAPYRPNSPYAASKAAADHFVRAAAQTHGLPAVIARSANNYGPFQFPEKLLPRVILHALGNRPLPLYGDGLHVRDWIHVRDHCRALLLLWERGVPGESYNIGGGRETANLTLVRQVCAILDELHPRADRRPHADAIAHVADRPGHDRRYALDARKIAALGWRPETDFAAGLRETVAWYVAHRADWLENGYADRRLGLGGSSSGSGQEDAG
jgi:dTDP-glucose 4,6-dehydratase